MTIINWYILKQFFRPFLASFFGLIIMVMFSQVIERLDRFLAEGVNVAHVVGYLLTSMPFQAMNILPIASLLATLFVASNLIRTKEYVAGLAGGIPPEKFLGGLIISGLFISIFALIANETVIPPSTKYSREVYRQKIRRLGEWKQKVVPDLAVRGQEGRLWNTTMFHLAEGLMNRVVVDKFDGKKIVAQIDAQSARYTHDGWVFDKGEMRTFDEKGIDIVNIERFEQRQFNFQEKPEDLLIQEPQPENMNFIKLKKHIARLSSLGVPTRKLEVELMMKLSFPFACFIVSILGVPLALRGRGNRAKGIALGALAVMVYMGFMQFGKAMAQRLIPPLLGAWVGNIVFLALAGYLWYRMRRGD